MKYLVSVLLNCFSLKPEDFDAFKDLGEDITVQACHNGFRVSFQIDADVPFQSDADAKYFVKTLFASKDIIERLATWTDIIQQAPTQFHVNMAGLFNGRKNLQEADSGN